MDQNEKITSYLHPTYYCDCNHPAIQAKAKELTKDATNQKEAALAIFAFTRDEILFAADRYNIKASETLNKGSGFCIPKTNVQIGLLRVVGIPARYHQCNVNKAALKGIVADFAYNSLPDGIWCHPWCECYLDGEWIACETLFDRRLFQKGKAKGIIDNQKVPDIIWDGEHNLCVVTSWIIEDYGTLASFDEVINKAHAEQAPELIGRFFRHLSNRYTQSLRNG